MSTQRNEQDYMKLNLQHEMTGEELNEIVTHIKYIPEPPLLEGFAEEAMNRWRSSKRALPAQESPVPLSARQQIKILFSQGWWRELILGVILFVVGYLVLSVTEMVSSMFILSIVGCMPLLVVVSHTARNTLCGMGELVRSFRIPLHKYVQARFLMAGLISILLNLSVTAMAFPVWDHELVFRTTLLWFIPILINGAVALVLSARFRNFRHLTTVLFMLPVFWMVLLSGEVAVNWMTSVQLLGLMGLTVLSAGIFTIAMIFQSRVLRKGGFLIGA
ncbi:hypothetical protein [Paenibacillus pseudetheri]|uniref:Uncharacterized protein n=1 Tax=Paenibacillus pseudetheri TaxID=2897682 RepID=A0ABN8FG63_9BACL|nr:hypothetical protein [Paenibacillus pseudetheri]CAH1054151.1 hypothetical protein PAECIP111894_00296 [Paenibacillus pseudetheri]